MAMQTPISVLQELCVQDQVTPKYEIISVEGEVHAPTFVYRVTVKDLVATASGQSKKKAKHLAAQAVLEMMTSKLDKQDDSMATTENSETEELTNKNIAAEVVSPYDDGIPGNPVGQLQELCMQRRWPPPYYEMVDFEGLAHERFYSLACRVGKLTQIGRGKSKKFAKRQAASIMLEELKDVPAEVRGIINDDNYLVDSLQTKLCLKDVNIPALPPSDGKMISKFHMDLKSSSGTALKTFHSADLQPDKNAIQLLLKIGEENGFNVTFVPIEHKSYKNDYQCLVQLATQPVAVCYGVGETEFEAKAAAAYDAINYLSIMTKM
ncbi:TARBP2 (predicted) [Pycnogonum litorale]